MAMPRDIRRLAFQTLYQLDARQGRDREDIRASIEGEEGFRPAEIAKAFDLALEAWEHRTESDRAMAELAPDWPAHRQAAVDRTILRLAHFEMTRGSTPPKVVVNEAVELAKTFSTDRSPAFVNALLDKVLKRLTPGTGEPAEEPIGG